MAIYQGDKLLASDINVKPGTTDYNDLSNKPSINGIALDGNKTATDLNLQSYVTLPANTDFNTITEDGKYKFEINQNTNLNQPILNSLSYIWYVEHYNTSTNNSYQITQTRTEYAVYKRVKDNNVWQPWYQIAGSGLDLPSNKSVDITLQTSNTIYTAEANGYIFLDKQSNAAGEYIQILIDNSKYLDTRYSSAANSHLTLTLPITKGTKFGVVYTASGDTNAFRLIYANSEVPMNERFPASTTVNEEPVVTKVTSTKKTRAKKTSS